ncbi:conserved hypothetical protein [Candidatus Terasakiella magnetica]|nr:conserved hypothetical protein [Candidatus Terasakiella magnetica]
MCSRFELISGACDFPVRFGLAVPPSLPARSEIRPTDAALVIGPAGGRLLRWGLGVDWDAKPLINARAETLAERPTFRRLLGQRVLVPANAWWEWRSDGRRRIKTRLSLATGEVFTLAGLVEGERFILVTCAASSAAAAIHDRMPALLTPEAEEAWLDPTQPFAVVAAWLRPHSGPFTIEAVDAPPPAQPDLFG